jgi:hypothetical protein
MSVVTLHGIKICSFGLAFYLTTKQGQARIVSHDLLSQIWEIATIYRPFSVCISEAQAPVI